MIRQKGNFLGTVLSIVAIGIIISSCGRRGALEAPKSATINKIGDNGKNSGKEIAKPRKKAGRRISKPKGYFILDSLIQ